MPLQLDVNGNITANDSAVYTWQQVVALNSSKLDIYGDSSKPIYRWRGTLDIINATLKIENIDVELYGISTTEPGIIRATGTGSIIFGNNEGLKPKNGCNIKITRKFSNNSNNFSLYSPLTYCTTDNNKFNTAPKIKIFNSRVFISSLTLMPEYGSRIYIFVSEVRDSILGLEQLDDANEKKLGFYIQPNGILINSNVKSFGINLLSTTTIDGLISIDAGSPLDTFAGAYYFAETYFEISNAQFYGNANFYSRDQSSGYIFLNSPSIDLANGFVFAVEDYYPFAECKKSFSHDLKLVDTNGNVSGALVNYIGRTNLSYTSDLSGILPTFKVICQETNVQSLPFPGNYTSFTSPVPVVDYFVYTRQIKSYLHLAINETLIINSQIGNNELPFQYNLTIDAGITQSNTTTVSGYTGITNTTSAINITELRTLNEIYDSRKLYWRNTNNVNAPYLEGTTLNLNGANLVVDGISLVSSSTFKSITTTGTITYLNNGNTTFPTKDSNGFRFKIYGLPTKSNSFPVIRIKKLSNNTVTNPVVNNGEVYIYLVEGEDYEIRADARGFIASNFIMVNTNTSSELQITLEEILDADNNPVYGNGIQQQKDLISYNNATNTISIAYDSNYSTIDIFSAVDKLEEILATATGLEIAQHPVYLNGKLVFIRNILTNTQSTIKIKPATGNTGDPELLFELVREGDEKPYNLFDFSTSNGRIIKYPTTVNTANINTSAIASSVWSNTTRTLTSSSALTPEQEVKLNNLDVAVSTRLSSNSYVQAPTTSQIRTEIESSTVLAKEATTASRASQISVDLIPTNTVLTTDSRLNNLDTTISSRLATSNYLAPTLTQIENSTVLAKENTLNTKASQSSVNNIPTAIRTELTSELSKLDANISTRATPTTVWNNTTRTLTEAAGLTTEQATQLTNLNNRITEIRANNLDNIDIAVSTRLATTDYNEAPTVSDIRTELSTELSRIDATVSSRATSANVWTNSNRSLTEGVTVTTNNDKTNYELSGNSINSIWNTLITSLTTIGSIGKRIVDFLDISISSRSSQSSVDTKPNLNDIESSTVLAKQATLLNIPTNPVLVTDTRLNTLDANISSRLATNNYLAPLTNTQTTTAVTNALNTKDVVTNTSLNTALTNIEVSGLNTDQNNKLTQISSDVLKLKKLRGLSGVSVIAKAPTDSTTGYLRTEDNEINLVITKNGDEEILSD